MTFLVRCDSLKSRLGRQVMELFAQVAHDQGAALIVVTHDQRALDVFDTIFEMEDGTIRQRSRPPSMRELPKEESPLLSRVEPS